MKIQLTASELIDRGLWDEYCELTGTSVWAVNVGQMESGELLDIPEEMHKKVMRGGLY